MRMSTAQAFIAAALIGVTAMSAASATPVPTTLGDPFPSGSEVDLTAPSGVTYSTPFGSFNQATITNFGIPTVTNPGGPDQTFDYTPTFTITFTGAGSVGTQVFTNSDFNVTIQSRSGLGDTGMFNAVLNVATFTGMINGVLVDPMIDPTKISTGIANYTQGGPTGLLVETIFPSSTLYTGYLIGDPMFVSTPLNGISAPQPAATPLPAALPLFGAGLGFMGWLARRRKAAAAPVAA